MPLPNADQAIVDVDKLVGYCLNPLHPRGRHKARVFAAALGIAADDADVLRNALREAVRNIDAEPRESDEFGDRYRVEFETDGPTGTATRP